jgi:hypothetical protein
MSMGSPEMQHKTRRLDGIERGLDTVLEILRAGGGPAR